MKRAEKTASELRRVPEPPVFFFFRFSLLPSNDFPSQPEATLHHIANFFRFPRRRALFKAPPFETHIESVVQFDNDIPQTIFTSGETRKSRWRS